jgi:hypothetical protein
MWVPLTVHATKTPCLVVFIGGSAFVRTSVRGVSGVCAATAGVVRAGRAVLSTQWTPLVGAPAAAIHDAPHAAVRPVSVGGRRGIADAPDQRAPVAEAHWRSKVLAAQQDGLLAEPLRLAVAAWEATRNDDVARHADAVSVELVSTVCAVLVLAPVSCTQHARRRVHAPADGASMQWSLVVCTLCVRAPPTRPTCPTRTVSRGAWDGDSVVVRLCGHSARLG